MFFLQKRRREQREKKKWADAAPGRNEFPEKYSLFRNKPMKISKQQDEKNSYFSGKQKSHPASRQDGFGELVANSHITYNHKVTSFYGEQRRQGQSRRAAWWLARVLGQLL